MADDTAALQAWLKAGGSRLSNGTYRITSGLTMAGDNRTLFTENAKIVADGVGITALTVTGNGSRVSVYVDGKNKASYGVRVTGASAIIENGRYENFYSTTGPARGIDVATSGGIIIRNNMIRSVISVGDATLGNGNGASRGIMLNARRAATAASLISGNIIRNIMGEEGDAIQLLFFDGTANPFNAGNVTISDNQILNVSRRFIKVQASNVAVERNKLYFDLATPPANPSTAIDVIRSEYVKVVGNEVGPNLLGPCIAVNGVSAVPIRGIEIRDNILRQKDTKSAIIIYLNWTTSPIVQGNTVYGGRVAVSIVSSTKAVVQGNPRYRGT
ncbi:hypothetical protein BJG92_02167 [Arthrobacter sp. SO5]|nr:hypothetical protein [Arthrobacter sp. SO5]